MGDWEIVKRIPWFSIRLVTKCIANWTGSHVRVSSIAYAMILANVISNMFYATD